jgi:DNA-binding transcriptional LysR family regulator
VVPVGHPWASAGADKIDLMDASWVLRERGSGTRSILADMLRARGLDLSAIEVALELPSNEAVRAAVEAGAGVTVMSRLVAAKALQAGTLAAAACPVPERQFFMLRHKEHYRTAAEREFMRLVERTAV